MDGFLVTARLDEIQELPGARHIGPFADIDEVGVFRDDQRIKSAQPEIFFHIRHAMPRNPLDRIRNRLDMRRSRAAASADNIQQVRFRKLFEDASHHLRSLCITPELVGQSRIGMRADHERCLCRKFRDMGTHFGCAERTVEADGQQIGRMRNRNQKRLDVLPREHAPAGVADCPGDHDRHTEPAFLKRGLDSIDRRLAVQRIEYGFDQQNVRPAVDQPRRGDSVSCRKFIERDIAHGRIVDVRRHGGGASGRTHGPRHETRFARIEPRTGIRRFPRDSRSGFVQLVNKILKPVFLLRNGVRVESIGLDDIRAGFKIRIMDLQHRFGAGHAEHVVVALEFFPERCEMMSAKVFLRKPLRLKHGAHCAVQNQDSFTERGMKKIHIHMFFHC